MKKTAVLVILFTISVSAQTPLTFSFHPTGVLTGYDYQSNGTPQLIWQDPNHPENVHMVFTTSAEISGWSDRAGTYVFSSDYGETWINFGRIQVSVGRGGYVCIDGLSNGHPIASMHINDGISATRTIIYVNDSLTGSSWTKYDPGSSQFGEVIWPRIVGINDNKIAFAGSINNPAARDSLFTNSLTINNNLFSGWNELPAKLQDLHSLAVSEDGNEVGLAYIGSNKDINTFGDVYYKESADGGITYNEPVLVYNYGDDSLGCYKGLDLIFLNNEPYIIFELLKLDFNGEQEFTPDYPAKIMLWSPNLNNGIPKLLADSNYIQYYRNVNGVVDGFGQICRPTIGRANGNDNYLFAAFSAPSPFVDYWIDTVSFFDAWFLYSSDKGNNWSLPAKINSYDPIMDWRYISLSPLNNITDGVCTVHMCISQDTIAGSWLNYFFPYLINVTCQLIHVTTQIPIISSTGNSNNLLPQEFSLSQNYPNPFNPETKINYQLPYSCYVTIKLFDVLGNEILILVNEEKPAGMHELLLNAKNLSSGIYYYKLEAGEFTAARKLILLK